MGCKLVIGSRKRRNSTKHDAEDKKDYRQTWPHAAERKPVLDYKENSGKNPLFTAVEHGKDDMVSALLERGASVNVVGYDSATPLMKACGLGNKVNVENIVRAGGDVNMVDKSGMNCLHAAAYNGKTEIAEMLLEMGVEINHRDDQGRTPLYCSCFKGHVGVTKILLKSGADHTLSDNEGKSPLHIACAQGQISVLNILFLSGKENIVQILLDNKCDINAQDNSGKTPLHIAVNHRDNRMAETLVKGGANVNLLDNEGRSALHFAVRFPKLDIPVVKLLLSAGCDPVNLETFFETLIKNRTMRPETLLEDPELSQWYHQQKTNPKSLQETCRTVIQKQLKGPIEMDTADSNLNTKFKIKQLPLPKQIKEYLTVVLLEYAAYQRKYVRTAFLRDHRPF